MSLFSWRDPLWTRRVHYECGVVVVSGKSEQSFFFRCPCSALMSLLPWNVAESKRFALKTKRPTGQERVTKRSGLGVKGISAEDCVWMGLLVRFKPCSTKYRIKRPVCCKEGEKRGNVYSFFPSLFTSLKTVLVRTKTWVSQVIITETCQEETKRIWLQLGSLSQSHRDCIWKLKCKAPGKWINWHKQELSIFVVQPLYLYSEMNMKFARMGRDPETENGIENLMLNTSHGEQSCESKYSVKRSSNWKFNNNCTN
jgi:hypothetical protein